MKGRTASRTSPIRTGRGSSSCLGGSLGRNSGPTRPTSLAYGSIGPGNSTAPPTIFPARRSFNTPAGAARAGGAGVEGSLSCPLPRFDREDAGVVRLRNLDRGKADAARPDDDDQVLFLGLAEGHDRSVRGGAAASKRGGERHVGVRRQRQDRGLLRHDEFRVAARRVEAQGRAVFTEIRSLASALSATTAGLLEMHSDEVADLRGVHIGADRRDAARDLVTGDQGRVRTDLDRIEGVEVRPADTGCEDPHDDIVRARFGLFDLNEPHGPAGFESNRTHIGDERSRAENDLPCGDRSARSHPHFGPKPNVPAFDAWLREFMEGSAGIWNRVRQKPFALWVIFSGFVYLGLVILGLVLPALVASPASIADPIAASIFVFMALFFVSAYLGLQGKRWTSVLSAVVSLLFLLLFGSFLVPRLASPADAAFPLAISGIPALILVAIFSILSIIHAKSGLLQKRYLATPNSAGGLLTIGIIC